MKFLVGIILVLGMFFGACGNKSDASTTSTTPDKKEGVKTEGASPSKEVAKAAVSNQKGKLVFKQYCIVCHGADGKLAVSGAKDLSVSVISKEEAIAQVTNGKGLMTPYKDILSEEQIGAVVDYIQELRK